MTATIQALRGALLLALALAPACAKSIQSGAGPGVGGAPDSVVKLPSPKRGFHLRVSFDDDASPYVGRFVPDGLPDDELDETRARRTRCSQYISVREVGASGSFDEVFRASTGVSGSLGYAAVAGVSAGMSDEAGYRIRYTLARKLVADVADPDGLDRCCQAAPRECEQRIVGELYRGTGVVYQMAGSEVGVKAQGGYQGVSAGIEYTDGVAWRRGTEFQDAYFAFRTVDVRTAAGPSVCDGDWDTVVPDSLDGVYFVGMSLRAGSEAQARSLAQRDAATYALRYLGETLRASSGSRTSALSGFLEDEAVVEAAAGGLVEHLQVRCWRAGPPTPTPHGPMVEVKALAFLPNQARKVAEDAAVEGTARALEGQGRLRDAAAVRGR
ncbi:MAG: hypothetical protein AMXMBFR64_48000 [Myxococcales bacterium]